MNANRRGKKAKRGKREKGEKGKGGNGRKGRKSAAEGRGIKSKISRKEAQKTQNQLHSQRRMNADKRGLGSRATVRHAFNDVAENTKDLVVIRQPYFADAPPPAMGYN